MDPKDTLVLMRAGEPHAACLALAARLAREHGAHVTGVCLVATPSAPIADGYAVGPAAVCDVLDRENGAIEDLVAPVKAAFERQLRAAKPAAVWAKFARDEASDATALRTRTADLTLVGRSPAAGHADARLAECVVMVGGAPCLVVPDAPAQAGFERVLLAWNGSRPAKRALDDGLVFLRAAAQVEVVVVDQARSGIDQAQLGALLRHLVHHGVHAAVRFVETEAGDVSAALRREVAASRADLLIMGAYSRPRLAELVLGGTTRRMLLDPPAPILISH